MTATLTFTLPGESAELAAAQHGARYAAALASLREELRTKRKHGHNFQTADEALEWMAQLLTEEILVATDVEGSPRRGSHRASGALPQNPVIGTTPFNNR